MILRPPSSPLLPYTTLFRSPGADVQVAPASGFYPAVSPDGLRWTTLKTSFIPSSDEAHMFYDEVSGLYAATVKHVGPYGRSRSEEHTSELQSQSNLVCRLLL